MNEKTYKLLRRYIFPVIFCLGLLIPGIGAAQPDTSQNDNPPPPEECVDDYDDEEDEVIEEVAEEDESIVFTETFFSDSIRLQKREIDRTVIQKMKKEDAFWYADVVPEAGTPKRESARRGNYTPVTQQTWFQTLLWLVIVGGFAAAVAMYLANSNVKLFRKKNVVFSESPEELVTDDIFSINYQKEIDKAVAKKDYRLAVRLRYLRLLKNMSDRNIIAYNLGKTNFEYLADLQATSYYKNFFRVTRHYEYSWYGHFDVSETAYSRIATEFNNMEKSFY